MLFWVLTVSCTFSNSTTVFCISSPESSFHCNVKLNVTAEQNKGYHHYLQFESVDFESIQNTRNWLKRQIVHIGHKSDSMRNSATVHTLQYCFYWKVHRSRQHDTMKHGNLKLKILHDGILCAKTAQKCALCYLSPLLNEIVFLHIFPSVLVAYIYMNHRMRQVLAYKGYQWLIYLLTWHRSWGAAYGMEAIFMLVKLKRET